MTLLHRGMAHVAQLRVAARSLWIEPAVWIAGARMGVVAALLPMKVGAIIVATVLGVEALV
jgi:hypothetical protein